MSVLAIVHGSFVCEYNAERLKARKMIKPIIVSSEEGVAFYKELGFTESMYG